ncbi:MAG: acyltransferase family protein [Dysgonomonas sp.]|nr:acyltransferase family protein [Dysgonomonas sp.]
MEIGNINRNVTLDYFKIFLSFLVITSHLRPLFGPGLKSAMLGDGLGRIAVPCFFIISGYFFGRKISDSGAIKKYLKHLLLLYVVWSLIYSKFWGELDCQKLVEYIFFGYSHLWYIPALFGGIIILVILKKIIKNDNIILVLGILLYIIGHFLEPGRVLLFFVRNALFCGFPLVMLGYYVRIKDLPKKIEDKYLIPVILISFTTLGIESYYAYQKEFVSDMFLSILIVCPAISMFVLRHSTYKPESRYVNYLGSLSSAIYFVHLYVIYTLSIFPDKLLIYRFPFIVLVSIFVSIILIFVNKRVKIFL